MRRVGECEEGECEEGECAKGKRTSGVSRQREKLVAGE